MIELNEENFLFYCAKYYENKNCFDVNEFYNDLLIPLHIKKLMTKYESTGNLKFRLIINHLILFMNVFTYEAAINILFFKIDKKHHINLKTFLVFLERLPEHANINKSLNTKDIQINCNLIEVLRQNVR